MKYSVDRGRFFKLLKNRPAMIRTVHGLDEALAIEAVEESYDVYYYLPDNLKTLKVSMALLNKEHLYGVKLEGIPQSVRDVLPIPFLKKFMKKWSDSAPYFPNMPYGCWLAAVENGFNDFNKIPDSALTEELVLAAVKHAVSNSYKSTFEVPEKVWTEGLCDKAIGIYPEMFNQIPMRMRTKHALGLALNHPNSSVFIAETEIPDESWDEGLALKAVQVEFNNIKAVPRKLVTKEMCLIAARKGLGISQLPVKDFDVYSACLAHGDFRYGDDINKKIPHLNDPKFQMAVCKENGAKGLENLKELGGVIKESTWVEMLKENPSVLRAVEKTTQTDEMIDAFFSSASTEIIDNLANCINLSKIHKEHVPMLIGCENDTLKVLINRKMKGPPKREKLSESGVPIEIVPTEDTLVLDIAPGEYEAIKGRL